MAEGGQFVCRAGELEDGGRAVVFDVVERGRAVRAFVLRHDGRIVGYLNRCLHVASEMDWQEGRFLDGERRYIVCSIHGATYEPGDGRCVGGPCGSGRLTGIDVDERDGQVYWYPSRDIRPVLFDDDPGSCT